MTTLLPARPTLLLTDLDARRTFDAYNVLRRIAVDLDARVVCAEEHPRTSSPYGATRRLRLGSQEMFDDDLRALADAHGSAPAPVVVVPASEALLERMLAARAAASLPTHVRALLPPGNAFARACDKRELPAIARDARVHTPALVPPPWRREELVTRLPLVAKPRSGRGGLGVHHLLSADDVDAHLPALDADRDLVMERVGTGTGTGTSTGTVHGAFALYEGGRCLAQYAHERVRTFPASGGVSTCAVRRDVDGVLALCRAVLDALAWEGLAMIEAMARPDGTWSLIEINPRLWGTILLDEFSGAFLLRNYVRRCLDLPAIQQQPESIRGGTTFRWAAGEALHAAQARHPRALVANPFDEDTCWSGVTYARPSDAARFFARAALQPSSIAKLKSKWSAG